MDCPIVTLFICILSIFILGDVYLIKNRAYGQNPYTGNGFFLEFSGHETLLCDDAFFSYIITKMNQYKPNGQAIIPTMTNIIMNNKIVFSNIVLFLN